MSKSKFKEGESYLCTDGQSNAYKRGQVYTCYRNKEKQLCLRGGDGFEDLCSMLVSKFEVYKPLKKGVLVSV